jgi:hypothetical protein
VCISGLLPSRYFLDTLTVRPEIPEGNEYVASSQRFLDSTESLRKRSCVELHGTGMDVERASPRSGNGMPQINRGQRGVFINRDGCAGMGQLWKSEVGQVSGELRRT